MPTLPIPPIVVKLLGGLLAVLALLMLVHDRNQWKHKAADRQARIASLCEATRSASGNPKLDCARAGDQIAELGKALKSTTAALDEQNARVSDLKVEGDRQQSEAGKAAKAAATRASRADSTAVRLERSARSNERLARPCEPSDALKGAWR